MSMRCTKCDASADAKAGWMSCLAIEDKYLEGLASLFQVCSSLEAKLPLQWSQLDS